jgi:hypothetical protein
MIRTALACGRLQSWRSERSTCDRLKDVSSGCPGRGSAENEG